MARLTLDSLTMRFRTRRGDTITALQDITFEVKDREFAVLVGTSGCGKSTMLRLAAGLLLPTTGRLLLDGHAVSGPNAERGMVFQSYTLFPLAHRPAERRVRASTSWHARLGASWGRGGLHRPGRPQRIRARLPQGTLLGMMQRVAIARALANDPAILLMDEPFGALDAQTRALMGELLLRVWEQSAKTVPFVTHDIEEALFLADRVFVLTARPG